MLITEQRWHIETYFFQYFLELGLDILKKLFKSLNLPLEDGETLSDKTLGNNLISYTTLDVCNLILICILLFNRKLCHFDRKKPNKKMKYIYTPNNTNQAFQFELKNYDEEEEDIIYWQPNIWLWILIIILQLICYRFLAWAVATIFTVVLLLVKKMAEETVWKPFERWWWFHNQPLYWSHYP